MTILAAVTGLIKGKQKPKSTLDYLKVIDSPVVEKIYNYNVKISNLERDIEEKRIRLTDLRHKLANNHKEYFHNDFDENFLKESVNIKAEIAELETIIQQMEKANNMRDVAGRKILPRFKLTDGEKQSLIEGFAPVNAKRDELKQQFLEKYAALEETLDQLKAEDEKVHAVFGHLHHFMSMGTEEGIWSINNLYAFKGGEIDYKMQELANKHQFYVYFPSYY